MVQDCLDTRTSADNDNSGATPTTDLNAPQLEATVDTDDATTPMTISVLETEAPLLESSATENTMTGTANSTHSQADTATTETDVQKPDEIFFGEVYNISNTSYAVSLKPLHDYRSQNTKNFFAALRARTRDPIDSKTLVSTVRNIINAEDNFARCVAREKEVLDKHSEESKPSEEARKKAGPSKVSHSSYIYLE